MVEHVQLLNNILSKTTLEHVDEHLKLDANSIDDLALVDDRVEWVSHLVRDGRVDQRQELSLRLCGVVQDLLRDIVEAEHISTVLTLLVGDLTHLELDEFELRDELIVNTFYNWEAFHDILNIFTFTLHLGDVFCRKILIECENFRLDVFGVKLGNFPKRILSLNVRGRYRAML